MTGNELKSIRKTLGLSVAQMAAALSDSEEAENPRAPLDPRTYRRWESPKARADVPAWAAQRAEYLLYQHHGRPL